MSDEHTSWSGSPSQAENISIFLPLTVCAAILLVKAPPVWALLPILPMAWYWLATRCTKYTFDADRLRIQTGILNTTVDNVELYRVRDFQLEKPLGMRLMGLGNITVISTDKTLPELTIRAIRNPHDVWDKLRAALEDCRRRKNVREIDV